MTVYLTPPTSDSPIRNWQIHYTGQLALTVFLEDGTEIVFDEPSSRLLHEATGHLIAESLRRDAAEDEAHRINDAKDRLKAAVLG